MTARPETGCTFRPAIEEDLAAIIRLLADDALGQSRERWDGNPSADYVRAFAAIQADPANEIVVTVRDGRVVGCMQLTKIPSLSFKGTPRMQIESVRIDARLRSMGVGSAMMRFAIARAQEAGCKIVQLTSNQSREDARRFYERLGFTPSHIGFKLHLAAEDAAEADGASGHSSFAAVNVSHGRNNQP